MYRGLSKKQRIELHDFPSLWLHAGFIYTPNDLINLQAIIGNYAVPILEENQVWSTDDDTRTSYLDSQDVARMTLAALRNRDTFGNAFCVLLFIENCWIRQNVNFGGSKSLHDGRNHRNVRETRKRDRESLQSKFKIAIYPICSF